MSPQSPSSQAHPRVSILIPCYNAERWISQAIESALGQTYPNKEVIVVDDGSTDGSLEIIKSFGDRIYWETGPNRGSNATRNRLLELAQGEWLQYLDADDWLMPTKIIEQVNHLALNPDVDLICGSTTTELIQDGKVRLIGNAIPYPRDPWILLAHWDLPQTGGPLWRKRSIQKVGGWDPSLPCCQEHDLYLRLLESKASLSFCDSCLAVYRQLNYGARISNAVPRTIFHQQRLRIMERIETHLFQSDSLNKSRRRAINDMRHATARSLWDQDPHWASSIIDRIRRSDKNYLPLGTASGPLLYSLSFLLIGFRATETLANYARRLRRPRVGQLTKLD